MRQLNGSQSLENNVAKPTRLLKGRRNRILNREAIDGRTAVAKAFDSLVDAIHSDLGGEEQLSAIERSLVRAFAGAATTLEHTHCYILSGRPITGGTIAMHAMAVNAMVRVASRLGLQRRSKDVGPTLGDILRRDHVARLKVIDNEDAS
jgi:hypothetical protein